MINYAHYSAKSVAFDAKGTCKLISVGVWDVFRENGFRNIIITNKWFNIDYRGTGTLLKMVKIRVIIMPSGAT